MPLTPKNRKEEWLQGLVDHETTLTPKNRDEEWMKGLIEGSTTLTPKNRCEEWIKEIIDASSGGGSCEIETGTWTPSVDAANPTISFANEHTTLPVFVGIFDATGNYDQTLYTNYFWSIVFSYVYTNAVFPGTNANNSYALVSGVMRKNSGSTVTLSRYLMTGIEGETKWYNVSDYISTSGFIPYTDPTNEVPGASTSLWRTNLTYEWIAVWAHTI